MVALELTLGDIPTSLYPLPGLGRRRMRSTSDTVAAIGLAIGGALGMAGAFVASDALRETLWTIDGVAALLVF